MPIEQPWWVFGDVLIASERELPGVYELGNAAGEVIYIGSSNNVARRLREHWVDAGSSCVKRYATQYRVEYDANYLARERELYALHMRIHAKPPRCGSDVDAATLPDASPRSH